MKVIGQAKGNRPSPQLTESFLDRRNHMTLLAAVLFLTMGCVPKKQFDALQVELDQAQANAATEIATRDAKVTTLEQSLATEVETARVLGEQVTAAKADLEVKQAAVDALTSEKATLLTDKSKLKATVEETATALKELQARRAQAEARIAQYRDLMARFKTLIDAGQLTVKIIDGRMVVVLATDVLFASGKADLSDAGKTAISQVGAVLATTPGRKYQVEGHTDNDPIKTAQFPSNWELASARAITVVRALVASGIAPERVSAASFGEFHPVADNSTPEAKAANRRIEITVVADLSQLPGFEELQSIGSK